MPLENTLDENRGDTNNHTAVETNTRPRRTRKTRLTSTIIVDDESDDEPKTKKKKTKKRKKEDEYVPPPDASDDEEIVEIHSEDVEEEPVVEKKKKKKKDPKTPTKSTKQKSTTPKTPTIKPKKETKKASAKKSTTKKKTKDVRYLTDFITNESLEIVPCPERIPIIVHTKNITISEMVAFPQSQGTSTFAKSVLLNTEPQKERKGYTESDTNERVCTTVDLDLHTSKILRREDISTAMLNIGAPIWALDWVSRPSSKEEQLAAISPHTLRSSFHKTGKSTRKEDLFTPNINNISEPTISDVEHCGKIQIWNMGILTDKTLSIAPYIQFYIEHDHGYVWDLKWMPNSYISNERLGILACACSDGSVLIFNVPHYSKILADYESRNTKLGSNEKLVLSLKPEVYTQLQHDSEGNTSLKIPYTISWSPSLKYFVSGYHDGTISLWKVQNKNEGNLLEHAVTVFGHNHPTNDLSIRSITWFDPSMNEYIFATCSNDGFFKIWDVRDIFYPYYSSLSGNRFWITGVAFPEKSNALITVSHDGVVRQFDAIENAFQLFSTSDGPIWDVSISSTRSSIIITTATGRVEVLSLEQDSMGKKRRSVDTRVDDLLLQVELVTDHREYTDNNPEMTYTLSSKAHICYSLPYHFRDKDLTQGEKFTRLPLRFNSTKLTPDIKLAMHRCLHHPSKHEDLKNWCLLGGYDGIVFLVSVPETFTSQN